MEKYEAQEVSTSPFLEKFLSGPGFIEGIRLNRINRLVGSLKVGKLEDNDRNRVVVSDGLVGSRIMRSVDIWEHRGLLEERHTVLDLYHDDDPGPMALTATQEVYIDEELSSIETYSDVPESANNLSLRNILQSLRRATRLDQAQQPAE